MIQYIYKTNQLLNLNQFDNINTKNIILNYSNCILQKEQNKKIKLKKIYIVSVYQIKIKQNMKKIIHGKYNGKYY